MMKFAVSSDVLPGQGLEAVAARAKELGYDGVEIDVAAIGGEAPADAGAVVRGAGLRVAALATRIRVAGEAGASAELARAIDAARAAGAPVVRVLDCPPAAQPWYRFGNRKSAAAVALARGLAGVADRAAEAGVTIALENALSLKTAQELWRVTEALDLPSLGVCWDVRSAWSAGEGPSVSVPTLNCRIVHVHVSDVAAPDVRTGRPCKMGEGVVPVEELLTRLRGIGYGGFVTVAWDAKAEPVAAADEIVEDAIGKLKRWGRRPAPEPVAKKTVAKKPATVR